jgi:hypothetical protein
MVAPTDGASGKSSDSYCASIIEKVQVRYLPRRIIRNVQMRVINSGIKVIDFELKNGTSLGLIVVRSSGSIPRNQRHLRVIAPDPTIRN